MDLGLDVDTIVAGLLHDVVEDTGVPVEELTVLGAEVAGLVDGVTKLGKIAYKTKEEQQQKSEENVFGHG